MMMLSLQVQLFPIQSTTK